MPSHQDFYLFPICIIPFQSAVFWYDAFMLYMLSKRYQVNEEIANSKAYNLQELKIQSLFPKRQQTILNELFINNIHMMKEVIPHVEPTVSQSNYNGDESGNYTFDGFISATRNIKLPNFAKLKCKVKRKISSCSLSSSACFCERSEEYSRCDDLLLVTVQGNKEEICTPSSHILHRNGRLLKRHLHLSITKAYSMDLKT